MVNFKFPKVLEDIFKEAGKLIAQGERDGWLIYAIVGLIFLFVIIMIF